MKKIFNTNGIPFWDQSEISLRNYLRATFAQRIIDELCDANSAWRLHVHEIEGPMFLPAELLNPNYTTDDVWGFPDDQLVMRPETTASSYAYMKWLMEQTPIRPPAIIWQSGKSFRREQEQVTKNLRMKEFYQQEFQCFYTEDTANDYQSYMMPRLRKMFKEELNLPVRVVDSDRLPSYSRRTVDVEAFNGDRWVEVCSVSVRDDFDKPAVFATKKSTVTKKLLVLEIAIGLCRSVELRNTYLNTGDTPE